MFQHQLNIVRGVWRRLESWRGSQVAPSVSLTSASSDKLRVLGETLLDILLYTVYEIGPVPSVSIPRNWMTDNSKSKIFRRDFLIKRIAAGSSVSVRRFHSLDLRGFLPLGLRRYTSPAIATTRSCAFGQNGWTSTLVGKFPREYPRQFILHVIDLYFPTRSVRTPQNSRSNIYASQKNSYFDFSILHSNLL